MRSILTALLVGCFCLPFVSCNEEEVNALKEQNANLQRQIENLKADLKAAQETKAEEEAAALAKAEEEKAAALAKAEEEKAKAEENAKEQSAKLKKEVLAIAKQMVDKEYDCAGLFYTSDFKVLKRRGYDEDLRQPSNDVAHYVDLFKSTLASHPNAESPPSLIKFNEIAQTWADRKKALMQITARAAAALNQDEPLGGEQRRLGRKALAELPEIRNQYMKTFLDSIEKLFE